jgi:hypothetical protein
MKWIIHKLRRSGNPRPWIAYSPHMAAAFATAAEALDYADANPITEPSA